PIFSSSSSFTSSFFVSSFSCTASSSTASSGAALGVSATGSAGSSHFVSCAPPGAAARVVADIATRPPLSSPEVAAEPAEGADAVGFDDTEAPSSFSFGCCC
ncbi:unnamed protein product, partial [Ectocarpus sp. 12 AP-2014]